MLGDLFSGDGSGYLSGYGHLRTAQSLPDYYRQIQQMQQMQMTNERAYLLSQALSLERSVSEPPAEEKKEEGINKKLLLLLED